MRWAAMMLLAGTALTAATGWIPPPQPASEGLVRIEGDRVAYPPSAAERHVAGPVVLQLTVDRSGRVRGVLWVSGNALLCSAAETTVRMWRFAPPGIDVTVLVGVNVVPVHEYAPAGPPLVPIPWGLVGRGRVHVTIDEGGRVVDGIGVEGSEAILIAAITRVLRWRTTPALLDGVAQEVTGTVNLVYGFRSGSLPASDVLLRVPPVPPAGAAHGRVIAEVRIDVRGCVEDVRILRSLPGLDEAAVAAVRQWRFAPLFVHDVAVPMLQTVTVEF